MIVDRWKQLIEENPHVCFGDTPQCRSKNKYLFLVECMAVSPQLYDTSIWQRYKGIITWNNVLYIKYKRNFNVVKIHGFPIPYTNTLDNYTPYDKKILGVILLCRHRKSTHSNGDITHLRLDTMKKLSKKLVADCYGKIPYGEQLYKGVVGETKEETFPGSVSKLQTLDKYMYNLSFENCYHSEHSNGYITEKIFDAFRAKVVPIYYGCYNIEEYVPSELFIDYRKFDSVDKLSEYLISFPRDKYESMVTRAFDFALHTDCGDIDKLDVTLKELK